MSAKEAKDGFGALIDTAQREPVTITRQGREVAVVLSKHDFEHLAALEDAYWIARAQEAEKEGYLGTEESERVLQSYLNEKN
jgi:prevent-host-death family protein